MIKSLMVAFNFLLVATGAESQQALDVIARSSPDETAPQVCSTFFKEVSDIINDNPEFFQNVRSGNSIRRRFKQDVAACASTTPGCSSQTASNAIQGMWDLVLQQKEGLCRTDAFAPSVTDQIMRERFTANNYAIVKSCCLPGECDRFNVLRDVAQQAFETMTNPKECPAREGRVEPIGNLVPSDAVQASEFSVTANTCSQPYLMTRELQRFTVLNGFQVNIAGVREQLKCDDKVAPKLPFERDEESDEDSKDKNEKIDSILNTKKCKKICYESTDLCSKRKCRGCDFYDETAKNCRAPQENY